MFAVLSEYILTSQFSHAVALSYTLWALGAFPGLKELRIREVPRMLFLVVATMAALVFVDGGINVLLYYGCVPDNWWFHIKTLLAAVMLFDPYFPNESTNAITTSRPRSLRPSVPYFALIVFGASLAASWIIFPWLYDNFPGFPELSTNPAWPEIWDILLKAPFQTVPLIFVLRSVYLDTKLHQRTGLNSPPPQYNRYGAVPERNIERGWDATDAEDDTNYLVAYLALLPIFWQLRAPWEDMNSFERTISVLSSNALIMIIMAYYFRLIRLARISQPVAIVD